MADLKLKILMQAVDRATAPFRGLQKSAEKLKGALGETAEKLKGLEATARMADKFQRLQDAVAQNAAALRGAEAHVARLKNTMAAATTVTAAMQREFERAQTRVFKLTDAAARNATEMDRLQGELHDAGVDTGRLADHQHRLQREIEETTAAAKRQAEPLERLAERARRLGDARDRMHRTQATAGAMAGAGAAGVATGGGALAAAGAVARVGIDFEAMMSKVGALARIDKTSEAFTKLEQQAFDLGASTSFSASQAAEAMSYLAMSGFKAEEMLVTMPGMLDLAKAGGTELAETANIAANILRGFGLDASQMGDVGDVLAATFTSTNTNLAMLGETMKYVAPLANAAGYSLGDMAAVTGLLGNVGIQGSDAGTALRAMISRLADPPKEAQKALAALGVSTKTVTGDMRPMAKVLEELAAKTENLGNADQLKIFSEVFGTEAMGAATELVGKAGSKGIAEAMKELAKNGPGTAKKIAAAMGDNAAGDIDGFTSALEGLGIALTKINTEPLRSLTRQATEVVNCVTRWVQANPELAATLTRVGIAIAAVVFVGGALALTVAGILGPFAMLRFVATAAGLSIGGMVGNLRMAAGGLQLAAGGARAFSLALVASPVGLIIAAIAAGALLVWKYWQPIAGFFRGLMTGIAAALAPVLPAFDGLASAAGTVLAPIMPIFRGIAAVVMDLAGWIGRLLQPVEDVGGAAEAMGERIGRAIGDALAALPGLAAAAFDLVKTVLGFTPIGLIIANWEPIAGFFADLWARLPGLATAAFDLVKTVLGFTPIGVIVANWEPIAGFFTDLWNRLPQIAGAALDGLKAALGFDPLALVTAAWQPVADFFTTLWDGILAQLGSVWGAIEEKIAGIKSVVGFVGDTWTSLFGSDDKKPTSAATPPAPTTTKPAPQLPKGVRAPQPPAAVTDTAAAAARVPTAAPVPTMAVAATMAAVAAGPVAAAPPPPTVNQTNSYSIVVNAPPGVTAADLAMEVKRQLDARDRQAQSAARSALYDR